VKVRLYYSYHIILKWISNHLSRICVHYNIYGILYYFFETKNNVCYMFAIFYKIRIPCGFNVSFWPICSTFLSQFAPKE